MATIPLGTKFTGLSADYPTFERRSSLINSESQTYTMQDIIDTVPAGAAVNPTSGFLPYNNGGVFADSFISQNILYPWDTAPTLYTNFDGFSSPSTGFAIYPFPSPFYTTTPSTIKIGDTGGLTTFQYLEVGSGGSIYAYGPSGITLQSDMSLGLYGNSTISIGNFGTAPLEIFTEMAAIGSLFSAGIKVFIPSYGQYFVIPLYTL